MKTLKTLIVALVAMVIGFGTAFGQVPMVSGSVSTAKPANGTSSATRRVALMSPPSAVNITVVPIVAPRQGTSESGQVLIQLIQDWVAGSFGGLVNDHGYQLCLGKISTEDINVRSSMVVQQLIEVKSLSRLDEISLSEVSVKSVSIPTALDGTYTVGENGYGPAAIGYKSDGSVVTDGAPTQKVAKIIFVTQMAVFNDSQINVDRWVGSWPNFTINYEVRHGSSANIGRATVSINGYGNIRPAFVMSAGGEFTITGGDQSRPYIVQSSSEVNGPYVDTGSYPVYLGDTWALPEPRQGPQRFFRLRDAGW